MCFIKWKQIGNRRYEKLVSMIENLEKEISELKQDRLPTTSIHIDCIHIDNFRLDKIVHENNFEALGIKHMSGQLNIGANYQSRTINRGRNHQKKCDSTPPRSPENQEGPRCNIRGKEAAP